MEPASETEKITDDPFAADIFASPADREKRRAQTAENNQPAIELKRENLWSVNLPQVRSTEVLRNALQINLLQHFSVEMLNALAESLTRLLTLTGEKGVEFLLTSKREISRPADFLPGNAWWLTVAAGGNAEIFFEISDALAVWLIETALEPQKADEPIVLRSLTLTEAAVLEYLVLNLAHEANVFLQSAQIRYRDLSREMPAPLQKLAASEIFTLLVYEFQTTKNAPPGFFKTYLTSEALKAFSPDNNLIKRMRGQIVQNLPEYVKNVRARLVCGNTELTFGELSALESGDVLLFDSQGLSAGRTAFTQHTEILLGDGDKQKIIGEFVNSGPLRDAFFLEENIKTGNKTSVRRLHLADRFTITIKSLAQFESSPPKTFMIETNDNLISENSSKNSNAAAAEQESVLAIENLAVSLRIELEARNVSLSEIAGMRENQTLELSVRPTDEVNILVNDRAIGRGELVLIEGERLGVKITKLIR